jgi:hypothetical protein
MAQIGSTSSTYHVQFRVELDESANAGALPPTIVPSAARGSVMSFPVQLQFPEPAGHVTSDSETSSGSDSGITGSGSTESESENEPAAGPVSHTAPIAIPNVNVGTPEEVEVLYPTAHLDLNAAGDIFEWNILSRPGTSLSNRVIHLGLPEQYHQRRNVVTPPPGTKPCTKLIIFCKI